MTLGQLNDLRVDSDLTQKQLSIELGRDGSWFGVMKSLASEDGCDWKDWIVSRAIQKDVLYCFDLTEKKLQNIITNKIIAEYEKKDSLSDRERKISRKIILLSLQ